MNSVKVDKDVKNEEDEKKNLIVLSVQKLLMENHGLVFVFLKMIILFMLVIIYVLES